MADLGSRKSHLRIGLLGPVEVQSDGIPATPRQRGVRALLAALAISANRLTPSSYLIDALWGDDDSHKREAKANLQYRISQLRRHLSALEPDGAARLHTAPTGYRLVLSPEELDVAAFTKLAARGQEAARKGEHGEAASLLAAALAMWRGPALADVAGVSLRLTADAAALDEQRMGVAEDHAEAALASGLHRELAGDLARVVAENPLRERLRGQLMLALYRCGRQADAIEVFLQGSRELAEELGVGPGPELAELYQRILRADPALRTPMREPAATLTTPDRPGRPHAVVPRQLAAAVRHFAGREAELKELDAQLDRAGGNGTVVITAVGGTGGIGKTALALHWAHRVAERFPDGQLHVNLRGWDPAGEPVEASEAVRLFLGALGVPPDQIPQDQDSQVGLYRGLLADRRMLILADNARDSAQVRPLVPASPGSLLLVTSRARLTGLAASDGAELVELGLLSEDESAALLSARLGPERLASEPEAVTDLITLCDRLPLALAIAAARAAASPTLRLAELAEAMRREGARLDELDTGEDATSVRSVFSWSYRQLPVPAAQMFRLLGLHPGPDISMPAAASLAGVERSHARRMLGELAAASLLTEHVPERYAMHDLLREYAAERAHAEEIATERAAALRRMLDHYLHSAYAATIQIYEPRVQITLEPPVPGLEPELPTSREQSNEWFKTERPVLLALPRIASDSGMDRHAWQIAWTMAIFLDRFGHWNDWMASQQAALAAAARLGDDDGQGHAHLFIARIYWKLGEHALVMEHSNSALDMFTRSGSLPGQARAHLSIGTSLFGDRQMAKALAHTMNALELYEQSGVAAGQADALNSASVFHFDLGHCDQAVSFCQRALDIHRGLGNLSGEADATLNMASYRTSIGDYGGAVSCARRAIELFAECGDPFGRGKSLLELGEIYELMGQLDTAIQTWKEGLDWLDGQHYPEADLIRAKMAQTAGSRRH